ncbi:Endoplasmic Reticulum-Golgi Intermediate Compartment (ERGIC) [Fragilaria crotonensis]|nr:Endoplasmic Reticulum-Golgi Intermediate Compartment (ERGIC) [Fragilaria crotonensis]
MALFAMLYLAFMETRDYFTSKLAVDLALDRSSEQHLVVNFDITMMDLKCEYASIDVVSFLGKQQNVSKNVYKRAITAEGVQQEIAHPPNNRPKDIRLSDAKVTKTLEELHEDGEHAISLDEHTFKFALEDHEFVFVDFFAPWCSHCVVFAPTWETLAEVMDDTAEHRMHKEDYTDEEYESAKKLELPVFIGKVDCVVHQMLCFQNDIMQYPTIRLFINGKASHDYWGHRDVYNLVMFLKLAEESISETDRVAHAEQIAKHMMDITDEEKIWIEKTARQEEQNRKQWIPEEHPGCRITGSLLMDRTPGHFYIQAQSPNHDMSPYMTNVSHVVHHLDFGSRDYVEEHHHPHSDGVQPREFVESIQPMDGKTFVTTNLHEAHHHYLKLVATNLHSYQVLQSSQMSLYREDQVPEAKFIIDLSPIRITYRWSKRHWYDYVTSLMAIVGGTFTVVGMLASGVRVATTRARK